MPATLLLVDDHALFRTGLRLIVQDHPDVGTIAEAGSIVQACELRLQEADLVLLDIQLPGMDGFEVLARLRADPRTAGVPVVAVSANAMPADRERAARAGFDEYVTKPIDMAHLLAVVNRWLAR